MKTRALVALLAAGLCWTCGGGGGGYGGSQDNDPWASQPAGGGAQGGNDPWAGSGGSSDEPPF